MRRAGFEAYLRDLAAAIPADGAPDPAQLAKVFADHDVNPA